MLLLTTTSDKVQVVLGQAVNVDIHASYIDLAAGVVTAGRTNHKPSTAIPVEAVPSPAASTTRNVKTLHVQNVHATLSVTVTIQHTDGTLVVNLLTVTLLAGERLAYIEGQGFLLLDSAGLVKVAPPVVGSYQVKALASDLTNATTTAAKVTGMDLVCGVGTWIFEYWIIWRSDTTTTGVKFGCNHSGTVTFFNYDMMGATADITTNTSVMDQDSLLTTGSTMSAWAARAKSATAPMIAAGVDTINLDQLMLITGHAVVTVAGNMELYHASEAATTTTVKAQSALRLTKVS